MIKLNAYAKVNLLLKILNKRPDGYHEIESIMQEISLHDGILLESNESESIDIININENKDEEVPWNEKNLAYKAAKIFKETFDIKSGLTIKINKNIPTSAGLGGGSSDAAATLIGVSRLWKTNLPKDRLAKIGEKIGSDVPFF
ncbi:MAG: 4-(cytidine 5'-diphospho)-2-C-methyl-D-erythritol kinase, partial [Candidatus Firestonebacteria bacterium]|nr:4-(cytidine 5'-diphospho)-2-C-methyl-D-erythritol kinase [Candidatus Firestonebacteria bacterium]